MVKTLLARCGGTWLFVLFSVLATAFASGARAHELQPTVVAFTAAEAAIEVVFRINLEAFLAGVDMDGVADTDEAEAGTAYDALRAQSPQEIEALLTPLLDRWNAHPLISVDGIPVPLQTRALEVPEDVPFEFARLSTWTLEGPLGPDADQVVVSWPAGGGAIVVRQEGVEAAYTGFLNGGDSSPEIRLTGAVTRPGWTAFVTYIPVGIEHIVPQGLDHILFVLGLFLLSTQLGPLLWQVTAFTLAHSVTLILGVLGLVTVPGSIVEPIIAASIVYVAVENIFFPGGLSRWRPAVVFLFGLLHGLGFAAVLAEFGLPGGQILPALIGFNVGVELGQLAVIAVAAAVLFFAVELARAAPLMGLEEEVRDFDVMFRAVSITGSLLIGCIGAWWVVERTLL